MLSGASTVGSQDNFVKQLNFVANVLTPTWTVAPDKIRVVINLMISDGFARAWNVNDLSDNQKLTQAVLNMTKVVPNVTKNNDNSLTGLFAYAELAVNDEANAIHYGERSGISGISRVVIAFVPQNPNSDQDFYRAREHAHTIRTRDDSKVILVVMGNDLDVAQLSQLSYGDGFTFAADYDNLATLVPAINKAICAELNNCGA